MAILRHAEEVTGNVSATCRYCGISRPTFDKWLQRYEELGEDGLRDGSSRPLHRPGATRTRDIVHVHRDNRDARLRQVTCPDCGQNLCWTTSASAEEMLDRHRIAARHGD